MTKQVLTSESLPPPEAVSIPFVAQFIDDEGELLPNESMEGGRRDVRRARSRGRGAGAASRLGSWRPGPSTTKLPPGACRTGA